MTLNPWPRPAVSMMVFRDDTVLLGKRANPPRAGIWSLPGGRVEPGETIAVAALRELQEETGVIADITGHAGTRDIILHDAQGKLQTHYVLTTLFGIWRSGEPVPASDCVSTTWVAISDLADYEMTEGTEALIRQIHNNEPPAAAISAHSSGTPAR